MVAQLDKILKAQPEIEIVEFLRGWGAAFNPMDVRDTPLYVGYMPTEDGKLIVLELESGLYAGQWSHEYIKVYNKGEEKIAKSFSKRRLRYLLSKCISKDSGKINHLCVPRKYYPINHFEDKESDGKRRLRRY
jgi:hypothetical protein